MSYSFQYTVNKNIGKLSWGMTVSPGEKTVRVVAGEWVETKENFFVSGVWDGEFSKGEFDTAEFFCGGGVKLEGNKIIASTATHERQRLVFMKKEGCIYVSNSVPFLLALTGEKPDVNCDRYEGILCSIIQGLSDYQKDIPLAGGKVMHQIFSSDLIIDENLNTEIRRKKPHRDFADFNDYYTSMKNVCVKILENGKSEQRSYPYDMITTTSSGYDSSGCAAVVYEAGCTKACTFKDGKYDEDSGAEIAEKIGYRDIIKAGCYEYQTRKGNLDATFFTDGDLGFFMPFDGFRDAFRNKIVVTGISGGYMWDRESPVNIDSKRYGYYYYLANISFIEHSLECGYIMLPLVLYASSAAESVVRISNSEEMKPWVMGNSYDRPIPRRILETSGVERGTFATANRGAGVSFSMNFSKKQIEKKMTGEGYQSFLRWLGQKGNNRWTPKRIWHALCYFLHTAPEYLDFIFSKLHIKTSFRGGGEHLYPNPGLPAKMVIWAMETVSRKYEEALK